MWVHQFHALACIWFCLSVTIISSIVTPSKAANTTRLSIVGNARPCYHLYIACGVPKPNASCKSRTDNPARLRKITIFCPVLDISMTGIVLISFSSYSTSYILSECQIAGPAPYQLIQFYITEQAVSYFAKEKTARLIKEKRSNHLCILFLHYSSFNTQLFFDFALP